MKKFYNNNELDDELRDDSDGYSEEDGYDEDGYDEDEDDYGEDDYGEDEDEDSHREDLFICMRELTCPYNCTDCDYERNCDMCERDGSSYCENCTRFYEE